MFRRETWFDRFTNLDERRKNVIATLNLSQGKRSLSRRSKYGVSLITVLMFMLISTIAATATYKWITSEGHSSASRLMEREAYQSAIAGIENTRAWMTFHAKETGALIGQYIYSENADGKRIAKNTRVPINLDQHIQSFAQNGTSQTHHVWLVGVNTDDPTYKLKILSQGFSRNGQAQHTEVAIFNVDGLYQVERPKTQKTSSGEANFQYAYFGGSVSGTENSFESAIINGNWSGNPPYSQKDFIVTGTAKLSGATMDIDATACFGGTVFADNKIKAKDLYVDGDINGTAFAIEVGQDAYFNGDVKIGTQPATIGRHMTLDGGKFLTNPSAAKTHIEGNLCVLNNGTLVQKNGGIAQAQGCQDGTCSNATEVDGNVWMPGEMNLWSVGSDNSIGGTCKKKSCTCTRRVVTNWNPLTYGTKEETCDEFANGTDLISVTCNDNGAPCSFGSEGCHCTDHTYASHENNSDCNPYGGGSENWKEYNCLILGGKDKDVYIKAGHKSVADYASLRGKKFTQTKDADAPRACKSGSTYRYRAHGSSQFEYFDNFCDYTNVDNGWDNGEWQPYPERHTANDKYYIYYMPNGKQDVGFGTYLDGYWLKCNEWGSDFFGEFCYNYGHAPINSYFINFSEKNMETRFTDGDANKGSVDVCDEDHPIYVNGGTNKKKCYRYLNHDGTRITGSPWCRLNTEDSKAWQPRCGVVPWFKSNGTLQTNLPPDIPFPCAEGAKSHCDGIWSQTGGCDGSRYRVNDPIVTGISEFQKYAKKGCAASITEWNKTTTIAALQKCYDDHKDDADYVKENFYNGFVVVELKTKKQGNNIDDASKNVSGTLTGDFIIIIDDQIDQQSGNITASAGSHVFLYLKNGAANFHGTVDHVFVYSEKGIDNNSKLSLTGTFFTPANSCAKVSLQNSTLTADLELNKLLEDNNIICKNDGSTCGGPVTTTVDESASSAYGTGGNDPYFISNAPQLGVTVESQYESREVVAVTGADAAQNLEKSYIVLPRVIYLYKDPYGKLKDYYNVVPLNGADVSKSTTTVGCTGQNTGATLNVGDNNLVSPGETLTEDMYICVAQPEGDYKPVPFYVWVKDTQKSAPQVSFVKESELLQPNNSYPVKVNIPPHDADLILSVSCPDIPGVWTIDYPSGTGEPPSRNGSVCTFKFDSDPAHHSTPTLFTLNTSSAASNGSVTFSLIRGEGYQIAAPRSSTLLMSSTVVLTRSNDVTDEDIDEYCGNHSDCPADRSIWPSCSVDENTEWVVPDWDSPGYDKVIANEQWNVITGGTKPLTLKNTGKTDCVVIIPETNNSIESPITQEGAPYSLRAIAKARSYTVKLRFVGEVTGNPQVYYNAGGRTTPACYYNTDTENHECDISVFGGESISFSIGESDKQYFSYWKCEGNSCPDSDPQTSLEFDAFSVHDNQTVMNVHFGEKDKHCFFDEFRRGQIDCAAGIEYCIDNTGSFTQSKWNLKSGQLSDIQWSNYPSGVYMAERNKNVVVMSSVEAGVHGTLKALIQPTHATASYGKSSDNIRKSGFMLRSDITGASYLMLNAYENGDGMLEVQLCTEAGNCDESKELKDVSNNKFAVTRSTMIMLSMEMEGEVLTVSAFEGSYYVSSDYSPKEYTAQFDLSSNKFKNYSTFTNQYLGFSLADPSFKLYGIGWKSEDYKNECFDGPPIVKCSFAASKDVMEGNVIPLNTNVMPWIGHSGWFDGKNCSPAYYYYNGNDVSGCSAGAEGALCPNTGYYFAESGKGPHGYGEDIKTAKASLSCDAITREELTWTLSGEDRAHCGPFWTGEFNRCHQDIPDLFGNNSLTANGYYTEHTGVFSEKNLRDAELTFYISNPSQQNVDVDVWLVSKNTEWNAANVYSQPVKITGSAASIERTIDVVSEFADNTAGFDPEKVIDIYVKNNTNNSVTVSSVKSTCDHTVRLRACTVARSGSSGWMVTLSDVDNPSSIRKIEARSELSTTGTAPSGSSNCSGCTTIGISDENILHNSGKTYTFYAKVTDEFNIESEEAQCTPEIQVDGISCSSPEVTTNPVTSGKPWPLFRVTLDCPVTAGCEYDIYKGNTKLGNNCGSGAESCSGKAVPGGSSTQVTISKQQSGNADECNDVEGCAHSYTIKLKDSNIPFTPCTADFTVKPKGVISATCTLEKSVVGPSGATKLNLALSNVEEETVITITGTDGSSKTVPLSEGTTSTKVDITAPSTAGSYTYSVTYSPNGTPVNICADAPALTVVNNVSCADPNLPGSITLGESFTFKPSGGGSCTSSSLTTSPASNADISGASCANEFTVEPKVAAPSPNPMTFTYTFTGDIGENKTCTFSVNVNPPPAEFECPVNWTGTVGENVIFAPKPNTLKNCSSDYPCVLKIDDETKNTSWTGPSYEWKDGAATTSTTQYTISLKNAYQNTATSRDCAITYSKAGCAEIEWNITGSSGNLKNKLLSNGCAIITTNRICKDEVQIKFDNCQGKSGIWNGVNFAFDTGTPAYYRFYPNPVVQMTNILNVPDCSTINEIYAAGCIAVSAATNAPTISNCPGTSSIYATYKPYAMVSLPITVSYCDVIGGCDYTISTTGSPSAPTKPGNTYDNKISFTGDAEGTYTYTLNISNTKGSASCGFKVKYDPDAATIASAGIQYDGAQKISFTNSKTCNVDASSTSWNTWVTGNVVGYWVGSNGQIYGSIIVDIPAGEWFKIGSCW